METGVGEGREDACKYNRLTCVHLSHSVMTVHKYMYMNMNMKN